MRSLSVTALALALASCSWLWGHPASAQTIVQIASTPEGCRIYLSGKDFIAEGCNLHVRDASGYTWCDNLNATPPATDNCDNTGNVIVGWNGSELGPNTRTGNHNLIVGDDHSYTAYGSVVAGQNNTVSGPYASVTAGWANTASGDHASVCGGFDNTASGPSSTVAGGGRAETSGSTATAVGGLDAVVTGSSALVAGGSDNIASGNFSVVLGGWGLEASGFEVFNPTVVLGSPTIVADVDPMPRNNGSYTTIAANGRSGLHQITFDQTMPCVPVVTTQMFNSGGNQMAPFILSIHDVTDWSFSYYLINPSNASQSAYTAAIHWTAVCN